MAEDLALALRRRLAPLDRRFVAAFAALTMFAAFAVAATAWKVAVLGGSASAAAAPLDWSGWEPRTLGFKGAQEIGEHVAPTRVTKLGPTSSQVALALPFQVGAGATANRVRAVVVRDRRGALEIDDGGTVGFSLCGSAPSCSLPLDTLEQRLLARREGLEVALYAFRYLGFDRIVVLLPPRPGDSHPVTALLFHRADLAPLLKMPLRRTISAKTPTVSQLDGKVGARIDAQTAPYFYGVDYVATPGDAAPTITLTPAEAG